MKKELLKEAITKTVVGIILIGLLLFIPAGTLSWLYGWIFMGVLFVPPASIAPNICIPLRSYQKNSIHILIKLT